MTINIKLIDGGQKPVFKHIGDACADCYANENKIITASPQLIKLGFALELPDGYEAITRPRSGLSTKGVHVAIGTIDSNYRGEVCAIVSTLDGSHRQISKGERICQLAIRQTPTIFFREVTELSDSNRGASGFGSTGV